MLVIAWENSVARRNMGTQGSTDGQQPLAGRHVDVLGRRRPRHGQVIGATERDGGAIQERPVTPGDLAATLFRYFDVPADVQYLDKSWSAALRPRQRRRADRELFG